MSTWKYPGKKVHQEDGESKEESYNFFPPLSFRLVQAVSQPAVIESPIGLRTIGPGLAGVGCHCTVPCESIRPP